MGSLKDDGEKIKAYARSGPPTAEELDDAAYMEAVNTPRPLPKNTKVVKLNPPVPRTVTDDALDMLEDLAAAIAGGEIELCHLVIGWGENSTNGKDVTQSCEWDAVGCSRAELIGHLTTYATRLAVGEGE